MEGVEAVGLLWRPLQDTDIFLHTFWRAPPDVETQTLMTFDLFFSLHSNSCHENTDFWTFCWTHSFNSRNSSLIYLCTSELRVKLQKTNFTPIWSSHILRSSNTALWHTLTEVFPEYYCLWQRLDRSQLRRRTLRHGKKRKTKKHHLFFSCLIVWLIVKHLKMVSVWTGLPSVLFTPLQKNSIFKLQGFFIEMRRLRLKLRLTLPLGIRPINTRTWRLWTLFSASWFVFLCCVRSKALHRCDGAKMWRH